MKATRSREAGSCEILRAKRSNIFAHRVAPITEQGQACVPARKRSAVCRRVPKEQCQWWRGA